MDWLKIKERVYFEDGSLRDIYIKNVSENDWRIWVELINERYDVSFRIYEGEVTTPKIEFHRLLQFWNGDLDSGAMASFFVGRTLVNAFFFSNDEFDNDITPTEFLSIEDHNALMDYLKSISTLLNKRVILTPEMMPETILLAVENGVVTIF